MTKGKKPVDGMEPNTALKVEQTAEETGAQARARMLLQPTLKNAAASSAFTDKMMGSELELPGIAVYLHVDLVEVPLPVPEAAHAAHALPADVGSKHRAEPVPYVDGSLLQGGEKIF